MLFNNGKVGKILYVITKGLFSGGNYDAPPLAIISGFSRMSAGGEMRLGANGGYRLPAGDAEEI
jgi:hypothetical protein